MTGRTGYTEFDNGLPPEGPDQMNTIFEHFDPLIGESVATASALPSSGNWVGRTIHVEDIDVIAQCVALPGTWKRWFPVHAMQQGVVTCPSTGGGLAGGIGWSDLITVTFAVGRFTQPPQVKAQTLGPAESICFGGVVESVTATGCKVRGIRVAAIPTNAYTVQWTAVQMLSTSAVG